MARAGDDVAEGKSAIARAGQLNRGDDLAGAGLLAVIRRCRGSILTCGGEGATHSKTSGCSERLELFFVKLLIKSFPGK